MTIQKTSFTLPREELGPFADLATLTGIALDVGDVSGDAENSLYRLTWFPADAEEQNILSSQLLELGHTAPLLWEDVAEENWQAKALADFPPIPIGTFVITRNDEEVAADKIRLRIPAAMAFGSGEHATTAACLLLYQNSAPLAAGSSILDMGCGSGILAIAAAKQHGLKGLCVDIHEPSVEICAENAAENDVAPLITALVGDGFETPEVQAGQPYPLIFANILANPLIDMAPALNAALADGGCAILSGFLAEQEADVAAAYTALGLTVEDRVTQNQGADVWVALTVRKAA